MKVLDTSSISNSSQFPIKKGTLKFLQDASKETLSATIKALIGDAYSPSTVYVLSGVINTGTAPVYTISSGAIFYNGEVYDVDAVSFSAAGVNVGVFSLVQEQFSTDADPVTFTDLAVRNVHNIRKIQVTQGAAGSTFANYSQAFFLSFKIPQQPVITATGQAIKSGVYPNVNIDVPLATNLNPVLFAGTVNLGDVGAHGSGGSSYAVAFGATLSTASYYIMGTIVSNGTPTNDSTVTWSIRSRLTTGFTLQAEEWGAASQNVAFEYIIFAK